MPGGHKRSLLVVGSVAFDSIETPNGSVDDALGGSATYFSFASSFFLQPRLDGLLLNDSEAKLLTGDDNIVRAGRAVRRMGPKFVMLKKGEHGAMLFLGEEVFVMPAYPTEEVIDPTGAGDSFAGGILGFLASEGGDGPSRLREAMAYGTVIASLTVEGFGLDRLKRADRGDVEARLAKYRAMLSF